jgi:ABC-2 type transport system permease protein
MISQGVMIRGAGWDSLWLPLVILAAMAVAIFGLAVLRLSRSISPVRQRARVEQDTSRPAEAEVAR